MEKVLLEDLLVTDIIAVGQEVELYIASYSKDCAFKGDVNKIPEGYGNFTVTGLRAKDNVIKIRIKVF